LKTINSITNILLPLVAFELRPSQCAGNYYRICWDSCCTGFNSLMVQQQSEHNYFAKIFIIRRAQFEAGLAGSHRGGKNVYFLILAISYIFILLISSSVSPVKSAISGIGIPFFRHFFAISRALFISPSSIPSLLAVLIIEILSRYAFRLAS
jgi:hypothetical protein